MMIGRIDGTALAALRLESARVARSAQNVANVNTPGYQSSAGSAVATASQAAPAAAASASALSFAESGLSDTDLISETVSQMASLQSFKATLAAFRTADEMTQAVLNLKA